MAWDQEAPKWLVPRPTPEDREFWEGARRGELLVLRVELAQRHVACAGNVAFLEVLRARQVDDQRAVAIDQLGQRGRREFAIAAEQPRCFAADRNNIANRV